MTTRLGNKLNRLVKERAYLGGDLDTLKKDRDNLTTAIARKNNEISAKEIRLAELDSQITDLSKIDPDDIARIKVKPRISSGEYGGLRIELMNLLMSQEQPVATGEMVNYIVAHFSYPVETPAERRAARSAVLGVLFQFKKRGVAVRLPSLDGSKQGRWQWVGYQGDNQA